MASIVDICNMALSHLGSDAVVASISPPDGSVEAGHCARFYPLARREALEAAKWTWSKTRQPLAQVTNPSEVWTYAYTMPSDCSSPMRVLQRAAVADFVAWPYGSMLLTVDELALWTERGSADFEVEGGVLMTHEPDAVLLYTRDVTDTTKFSSTFLTYLSYLLGAYLSGPIIKGQDGMKTALAMRKIADQVLASASMDDANGSSEGGEFIPAHLKARA